MAASCRRRSSTDTLDSNREGPAPGAGLFVRTRNANGERRSIDNIDRRAVLTTGAPAVAGGRNFAGGGPGGTESDLYSRTPENVGPVVKGDVLLCKIEGLPDMSIKIV